MNAIETKQVVQKCKDALTKAYGNRLKGVILYGSVARKTAGLTSDIDLLVILHPPVNYFPELRRIIDVLYPVQLESELLISAKPVSAIEYEAGSSALYRNAAREGIAV